MRKQANGFSPFRLVVVTTVLGLIMQASCSHSTIVNQRFVLAQIDAMAAASSGQAAEATAAAKIKIPVPGDVLIAGGVSGTKSTGKAQFYDPTTKKFSTAGAMSSSRIAPCGLSLANSPATQPIFVFGGAQGSATTKNEVTLTLMPLNSAEQYAPATGLFSAVTGSMTAPRAGCTATLLSDGTVLIAGGLDATGAPQTTAEIFDPVAVTFTATKGSLNSPRAFQTATLFPTGPLAGEVLLTGGLANNTIGSSSQGLTLNTAELYNPATGTFSLVASSMSDFRAFHTATALQDGTVLVAGGDSDGFPGFAFGATATADIFDPATQTFTATAAPMAETLLLQGATLLADGTVLITGGFDASQIVIFTNGSFGAFFGSVAQGAELYNPTSKTFSCIGGTVVTKKTNQTVCASTMKHPHAGHAAVRLTDGTVLVAGGFGGSKDTSNAKTTKVAEIYDPTTQTFTKVGGMKTSAALSAVAIVTSPTLAK
ncbi:MAG TPA: kelch repeat-containing protein [Candidatus Binataceae bacterium]|nr:kelch repeat-containing protein [Candidatus Binataceae bacterium]